MEITCCAVAHKFGYDCVVLGYAAYVAVMQSHGPMWIPISVTWLIRPEHGWG